MNKFCFVIHPLSLEDVARYEPGAKGKGDAIMRKIMEWMPPWAVVHVTGVRTPDGRETEGWFVSAPLLPEQMVEFPREEVYARILAAIRDRCRARARKSPAWARLRPSSATAVSPSTSARRFRLPPATR